MPEGPEIVITEQYLKTKIRKKKIEKIEILSGRYTHQKLKGLDLINFPLTVEEIDSKGKFLWMILKDSNGDILFMMNTFGMTGKWSFSSNNSARIKFTIRSIKTKNKTYTLYYIDPRNFGTMEFTNDKDKINDKIKKLAPDILKTTMTDDDLALAIHRYIDISKRKQLNLVKTLMDQESIVSGIGNYLVAEILYDAKLNPHRNLNDLSEDEIKQLAHSIRKISKYAYYDNNSGYMEYFKNFMKTHTNRIDKGIFPDYHPDIKPIENFQFKVYQQSEDPNGYKVIQDEIVKGRTIHWIKEIQK